MFWRPETAEERAYISKRNGAPEQFTPSLSVGDLLGFRPAMPLSSAAQPVVQAATVLSSLREVAGAADYTPERWGDVRHTAEALANTRDRGVYFFVDGAEKKAFVEAREERTGEKATAEEKPDAIAGVVDDDVHVHAVRDVKLEEGASKAVREYILQRAVKGQHVGPKFVPGGSRDPVNMAKASHLHNETYVAGDMKKFDDKIAALVAKKGAAGAAKGGKAARA